MYPKLIHPFTMIVAGPSGCGKTTFACNLIKSPDLVNVKFNKILWYSNDYNAIPKHLQTETQIEFKNKLPEEFKNFSNKPMLIVLDDFMTDANSSQKVCELFTIHSHHRNISVLFLTQNIFHKGTFGRTISLNAKYIVLFKNPRDKSQFNHLARQIYPEKAIALQNLYKAITQSGHSYLFIDLTQRTNDSLRFRTNIFNKQFSTCYCDQSLLEQNGFSSETIKGEQAYALRS